MGQEDAVEGMAQLFRFRDQSLVDQADVFRQFFEQFRSGKMIHQFEGGVQGGGAVQIGLPVQPEFNLRLGGPGDVTEQQFRFLHQQLAGAVGLVIGKMMVDHAVFPAVAGIDIDNARGRPGRESHGHEIHQVLDQGPDAV